MDETLHDPSLSGAILEALREKGWLTESSPPPLPPPYTPTLRGVYANQWGLYSRFFREVGGKTKTFSVALGARGVFTRAEEERLHALWIDATAAFDEGRRRGNQVGTKNG